MLAGPEAKCKDEENYYKIILLLHKPGVNVNVRVETQK